MRASLFPPTVIDPTPLPPLEMRLIRTMLAHRPTVTVMAPVLGWPRIAIVIVRILRAIARIVARSVTLAAQKVVAPHAPRPPPESH